MAVCVFKYKTGKEITCCDMCLPVHLIDALVSRRIVFVRELDTVCSVCTQEESTPFQEQAFSFLYTYKYIRGTLTSQLQEGGEHA